MKWLDVTLAVLITGLVLIPVISSGSPDSPLREATFVVG